MRSFPKLPMSQIGSPAATSMIVLSRRVVVTIGGGKKRASLEKINCLRCFPRLSLDHIGFAKLVRETALAIL